MCNLVITTRILSCNYSVNCARRFRFGTHSLPLYQAKGKTTPVFAYSKSDFFEIWTKVSKEK